MSISELPVHRVLGWPFNLSDLLLRLPQRWQHITGSYRFLPSCFAAGLRMSSQNHQEINQEDKCPQPLN